MWTTQFLQLYGRRQMLTSGGLGTMGYGLPAAIGAAIGNPGREVVCVSGDGGFQYEFPGDRDSCDSGTSYYNSVF